MHTTVTLPLEIVRFVLLGFPTKVTLPLGGSGLRPGEGEVSVQSELALHPPLASLDPPRGRVTSLSSQGEDDLVTLPAPPLREVN